MVGMEALFQWGLIDPNGALGGTASFSDALEVVVGT
jgi:hypothetical protein